MKSLTSIEQIDTAYLRKLKGDFENAFTYAGVIIKHGVNVELSAREQEDPQRVISRLKDDLLRADRTVEDLRGTIDDLRYELRQANATIDRLEQNKTEARL